MPLEEPVGDVNLGSSVFRGSYRMNLYQITQITDSVVFDGISMIMCCSSDGKEVPGDVAPLGHGKREGPAGDKFLP